MLSWVVLNFILVIYSNATQLTYSLIGLLAMARRVIWIRSVRPSVQKFSWNWLFSFFRELNIFVRAHVVLGMTLMLSSQNEENRPSPGFFGSFRGKFSFFLSFIFGKLHIWENSGFWDIAQNALGQSDCRIFQSIAGL